MCRAYRRGYPTVYANTPTQPAQGEEDVEYNKILESGFTFKTAEVEACERDVNTPADLEYLREKYASVALAENTAALDGAHPKTGEL